MRLGKNLGEFSPFDSKEKYIDSIVARIQEEDDNQSSTDEASNNAKNKRSTVSSKSRDLDSEELSSFCFSYKSPRNKKDRERNVDRTANNPMKSKKKKQIPISVTKEEAEKELQYSRENWLRMNPAALGERYLAHLTELEQQRSRCSNISGRVAGRMKESRQIATEITMAIIRKLITVSDVFSLRNENFSLKQEFNEIK